MSNEVNYCPVWFYEIICKIKGVELIIMPS